jgi:hypothetical protein
LQNDLKVERGKKASMSVEMNFPGEKDFLDPFTYRRNRTGHNNKSENVSQGIAHDRIS